MQVHVFEIRVRFVVQVFEISVRFFVQVFEESVRAVLLPSSQRRRKRDCVLL